MIKRLALSILILFLFSTVTFAINTPALHTDGKYIKDPSGNTVILRGLSMPSLWVMGTRNGPRYSFYQSTYPTETWENCAMALIDLSVDTTKHDIGWYPRILRFPIYPVQEDADPGWNNEAQRATYNARIQMLVDYASTKGIYVIIDWHYIANYGDKLAPTQAFWDWAAPAFKNYTNVLYEIYNEPIYDNDTNKSTSWATWKTTIAQPVVDRIRNTHGATNLILVGAPNWSQKLADADTNPVSGTNIVYVCHLYPYHWDGKDQAPEAPDGDLSRFLGNTINSKPVIFTEWGFRNGAAIPCDGDNEDGYASGFKSYLNTTGASWTGWCFDPYWDPTMFTNDWTYISLLGGDLPSTGGSQGKFIQTFLLEKKDANLPGGGGGATADPTAAPTQAPTSAPTQAPTADPTATPGSTTAPTATPGSTTAPTATPGTTAAPTATPTAAPTEAPTAAPTGEPTQAPTADPTAAPTAAPTAPPGGCTTVTGTNSGNFNTTDAYCFQTQYMIAGWGVSNFDGRTVSVTVNGSGTPVTVIGGALPSKGASDYYVFQCSAGVYSYASAYWW